MEAAAPVDLLAGLNVVPKRRTWRRTARGPIAVPACGCWEPGPTRRTGSACLRGSSFDLDRYTVPANGQEEPLERHSASSRGRRQEGVLVFSARDATGRVLRSADAGIPKAQRPDEVLKSVAFWGGGPGVPQPSWRSARD